MAKDCPGQPILVALGLKDDEIARQVETATAAIINLRKSLPQFTAVEINAWSDDFKTSAERLKLLVGIRRNLLARAGVNDLVTLKAAIDALPQEVRLQIESSEKRLKLVAFNLRRELRSLSYFARLHLSHLDGILGAIGEAVGIKATYRPGRPAIGGNLGIVDATA